MTLDHQTVINLIGRELADMLDESTLRACLRETQDCSVAVTAEEVAVARALLFTVSGSALLNGERGAIVDAGVLYRMVCTANNLLIGSVKS